MRLAGKQQSIDFLVLLEIVPLGTISPLRLKTSITTRLCFKNRESNYPDPIDCWAHLHQAGQHSTEGKTWH